MTFLLCDPGWCVHKSDVQNKWDAKHNQEHCFCSSLEINYNVHKKHLLVFGITFKTKYCLPRLLESALKASQCGVGLFSEIGENNSFGAFCGPHYQKHCFCSSLEINYAKKRLRIFCIIQDRLLPPPLARRRSQSSTVGSPSEKSKTISPGRSP